MMLDEKLISAIEHHEGLAETYGNLSDERTEALDYYLGNPMGNEVPGRSQVISRTVWDTVEWIKPQLADIFTSGEEVVSFSARGPEDVKGAEQETDYVNYIISQRNDWFNIWYNWSHDALIQKNGYVKCFWDDSEDITVESYNYLTDDEFALLMQAQDVEMVEHSEQITIDEMTGMESHTHSVKLQRKKPCNLVKVENLPPEFVLVDHNARGLSLNDPQCSFVEHREYRTISQLRQDGFDVPDDISDSGDGASDWESELRDDYTPFKDRDRDGAGGDPSMRRVMVRECWIRVDYDEDGIAELRHVIVVGTTVLLNEDADLVPIVALCPTPMAHRHYGLSVSDAVMDLQRIQTALLRGALDNQYLSNNGRYGVNADMVNLDDMLDSRPGGIVRVQGNPGEHIMPLNHSTNGAQVVPMMEYVDKIAQKRTGVSEMQQGLNPNVLNNQAGANANSAMMTAAQQRIKFIARIFAETGVRALFQIVHALTLKNSRQQEMVELRGEWVPIDPRQWVKRKDMQISVGLGMGDKPMQLAFLGQTMQAQMQMLPLGVTNPALIYNTLARMAKVAGYKDASEFWQNPAQMPPPPPPGPPPEIVLQQMKMQADVQKTQAEMTVEMEKVKLQAEAKLQETQAQLELQASNDQRDGERAILEAQMRAQLEQAKMESDRQIAEIKAQMDKYKADLESQTRIYIEQLKMGIQTPRMPGEPDPVMESFAQSNYALVQSIAAVENQSREALAQISNQIGEASQRITEAAQQMSRPKQVIRDNNGKIQGVV